MLVYSFDSNVSKPEPDEERGPAVGQRESGTTSSRNKNESSNRTSASSTASKGRQEPLGGIEGHNIQITVWVMVALNVFVLLACVSHHLFLARNSSLGGVEPRLHSLWSVLDTKAESGSV